jgi:hypothetical protein
VRPACGPWGGAPPPAAAPRPVSPPTAKPYVVAGVSLLIAIICLLIVIR